MDDLTQASDECGCNVAGRLEFIARRFAEGNYSEAAEELRELARMAANASKTNEG